MSYVTKNQLDAALATRDNRLKALEDRATKLEATDVSEDARLDKLEASPVVTQPPASSTGSPSGSPTQLGTPSTGNLILVKDFSTAKSVQDALGTNLIPYLTDASGNTAPDPKLLAIKNGGLYTGYPANTNAVTDLMLNYPNAIRDHYLEADAQYDTNFTTHGGPAQAAAEALKVLLPGLTSSGGRITLDVTDTTQYQLSLYAEDSGKVQFLPQMNSFDPNQGSQRWAVGDEWTSGAKYTYRLVIRYPTGTSIAVEAWFGRTGSALTKKLTVNSTCIPGYTAPAVNRAEIFNHYNQQRNFATGVTIYGVRVGSL